MKFRITRRGILLLFLLVTLGLVMFIVAIGSRNETSTESFVKMEGFLENSELDDPQAEIVKVVIAPPPDGGESNTAPEKKLEDLNLSDDKRNDFLADAARPDMAGAQTVDENDGRPLHGRILVDSPEGEKNQNANEPGAETGAKSEANSKDSEVAKHPQKDEPQGIPKGTVWAVTLKTLSEHKFPTEICVVVTDAEQATAKGVLPMGTELIGTCEQLKSGWRWKAHQLVLGSGREVSVQAHGAVLKDRKYVSQFGNNTPAHFLVVFDADL